MNNADHLKLWEKQLQKFYHLLGKKPDLNGILFLIGVQELGKGFYNFSKEQKQDLMSLAVCRLLEPLGYFEFIGYDKDGWPLYKKQNNSLHLTIQDQEYLLQKQIIDYFKSIDELSVFN
jgi:hypothetical protein